MWNDGAIIETIIAWGPGYKMATKAKKNNWLAHMIRVELWRAKDERKGLLSVYKDLTMTNMITIEDEKKQNENMTKCDCAYGQQNMKQNLIDTAPLHQVRDGDNRDDDARTIKHWIELQLWLLPWHMSRST